jgi:very-short-patch-repair endonuclease
MARFTRKFDAKAYWATKPYCTVCKNHKVKEGNICYECKQAAMKQKRELNKNNEVEIESFASADIETPEPRKKRVSNISAEAQNKVVRLFTYLEKALAVDDSIVRDFRTNTAAPSPWWLADYPTDLENLSIRPFDTEKTPEGVQSTSWLKVEKKNIKAAPELPSQLEEWIDEVNPLQEPVAKEKVDRKVRFADDKDREKEFKNFRKNFEQGDEIPEILKDWVTILPNQLPESISVKYVPDNWADHPELAKLLDGYTENEWKPWAEQVKKVYKANLLYDQLYALRLLLKNEGDNYELLLGHGVLTWQHQGVGTIYTPVFLSPLTLDFDASKRTIEINPDPMFRNFVETSSLYETDNPAEMDLITWGDTINANPFDFWHLETLKGQAQTLVNYISPDGEDNFTDEIVSAPTASKNPSIWNAPVIFARKRTNDMWSKYAATIRKDIEQYGVEATEFITDLVGEYDETPVGARDGSDGERMESGNVSIPESELYFPLPWNDEQKRIAERLDANYGVVVKGPPGTGKSHTIANLISRFLAQGKSVLVTSQTSKALEVLREKLPENIRSLAVSQLQQTAKRDDVLQQSIGEISSNLGERDTKFSEARAENVRRDLKKVREEKATLAAKIRQYILTDSSENLVIDGEEIKPIDAAKFVDKNKDNEAIAWFTDKVPFDSAPNFTEEDLQEIYDLAKDVEEVDRSLHKEDLPDPSILPNEDVVLSAFAAHRDLSAKSKASDEAFSKAKIDQETLGQLWELLSRAKKVLGSINQDYEQEIFDACAISQNERDKWSSILSKISEKIQIVAKGKNNAIGHVITGQSNLSTHDLREAVEALYAKASKGKLGTFGKMLLPGNAKRILETYKVDGAGPDSPERVEILRNSILVEAAEREIKTLLEQGLSALKNPLEIDLDRLDLVKLEVFVASIQRLANYHSDFAGINTCFNEVKELSDLSFTKKTDIETAIELTASRAAAFELKNLEKSFTEWEETIRSSVNFRTQHVIVDDLAQAIVKRNSTGWKSCIEELNLLVGKKEKATRLNELCEQIKEQVPNLCREIIELADQKQKFDCPENLLIAWKVARLESWLNHIHDHVDVDTLQSELERLNKKEFELNSELVTVLAWQRQIDKVTKRQRDALMAWSDAMKKYGKGTGKYANKWLNAAQQSLKEAKNAVPVWIMPLHRAAQMFSDPTAGMFDVVIFDEASQCDIRGLTIGYLGKKLLVVGDPDQISPAGIFQDQEKTFELISRFLFDIPHKDNFSITSSLFDLAKIRIPNMIQLNEHFRCVPEVIAFSNYHIYDSKLKPLRHPHPKGLLKPALAPILVEGGYQNTNNKVNEPEAKAVVEKLVELLEDPNYQKRPDGHLCSFGIISLLAEDQAKYIKDLILKHPKIGEKVIEERKIICGDAYAFQGDERDVMLLSMVRALDPNKPNDTVAPLTDKGAAQRFNVAATRARDQVFLFHSIPLEEFRNQNDWRFKLLNWYYDPKKEELKAGREILKKEFDSGRASNFSYEVGNLIIDKGYQVLPEYPVIGYRIDLVVQGAEARLAVECDGDQYHTLENWEEDQVRERQLRRAGWEFWRVTGSSFYRHKEKALDSLWKKLDELGIKPMIDR